MSQRYCEPQTATTFANAVCSKCSTQQSKIKASGPHRIHFLLLATLMSMDWILVAAGEEFARSVRGSNLGWTLAFSRPTPAHHRPASTRTQPWGALVCREAIPAAQEVDSASTTTRTMADKPNIATAIPASAPSSSWETTSVSDQEVEDEGNDNDEEDDSLVEFAFVRAAHPMERAHLGRAEYSFSKKSYVNQNQKSEHESLEPGSMFPCSRRVPAVDAYNSVLQEA